MLRRRPPPKRGPIVDVLRGAAALLGSDVYGLADTCYRFGIDPPPEETDPIDRLRGDALAIARLYVAELAEVRRIDLGLDLSTLASTGGIGTALFREAGLA